MRLLREAFVETTLIREDLRLPCLCLKSVHMLAAPRIRTIRLYMRPARLRRRA